MCYILRIIYRSLYNKRKALHSAFCGKNDKSVQNCTKLLVIKSECSDEKIAKYLCQYVERHLSVSESTALWRYLTLCIIVINKCKKLTECSSLHRFCPF